MPRRADFDRDADDHTPAKRRRSNGVKPTRVSPRTSEASKARRKPVESDAGSGSDSEAESEDESESADDASEDEFEPDIEEEEDEGVDDDEVESVASVDSEELDDKPVKKKSTSGGSFKDSTSKPKAKAKAKKLDDDFDDIELEEGQYIAGRIYPAPTTGLVPAGQISQNTFDFLSALQHPENNDRDWFKSHDPAFRMAEKEHRAFVDVMQIKFNEADDELPVLPARDICHRIYRDIRFSSDKTPYKSNFGLTYSRSGRRGIWAGYHLYLEPGYSLLACGVWQPEKAELNRIRERLLQNPQPLRDVISSPEFVAMFGEAKPAGSGKRRNVFGHSDMLKVAPKGIDKNHKDIDLLKLKSITVVKKFSDDEVLDPHFVDNLKSVVQVMAPFVHTINDYLHPEAFGGGDSD